MAYLFSLLPIITFLIFLLILDSFKLITIKNLIIVFLWGIISAFLSFYLSSLIQSIIEIDPIFFRRYFAPLIEEVIKASIIVLLIHYNRVGFMIDAAIYGFAVGCGFSVLENIFYIKFTNEPNMMIWILRGFGTAFMHGGTTAILSIILMKKVNETQRVKILYFLQALLVSYIIHSFFNHFVVNPFVNTIIILITVPILLVLSIEMSERSIKKWLNVEFDTEAQLLYMIKIGKFSDTNIGKYLNQMKNRFSKEYFLDMICFVRVHLELSLKAKSNMMMREMGFNQEKTLELDEKLKEYNYLLGSIGKMGYKILKPLLRMDRKDIWKINYLQK